MSCCEPKPDEIKEQGREVASFCPKCKIKGIKVQIVTPKSLLKDCCNFKIRDDLDYRFCKNSDCDITYFSEKSDNIVFTKEDLKVKATAKDSSLDVHVCYCFCHTRQSVLDEIVKTGESTVVEDIKAKMKDLGCFCEKSNPQGECCLANNIAWVKEAKKIAQKKREKDDD